MHRIIEGMMHSLARDWYLSEPEIPLLTIGVAGSSVTLAVKPVFNSIALINPDMVLLSN